MSIRLIKAIHTAIWAVMVSAIFYIIYAGLMGQVNLLVWLCVALIIGEGLVLAFNRGTCPLTPWAEKYTTDRSDNFGIYLPPWLAKHNKTIFTILFVFGLILLFKNL